MAGAQGSVRYQLLKGRAVFLVEGFPTMPLAWALRRTAEQALAAGARAVLIDLRRCLHMDSTFLGTLLRLQRAAQREAAAHFALLEPSPECRALLGQVGIEDEFTILPAPDLPAEGWTDLAGEITDQRAFRGNVCQAHQELAGVPGPAGRAFRSVADCLARELEEQRAKDEAAAVKHP